MLKKILKLFIIILAAVVSTTFADKHPSHWDGSQVVIGFTSNSGNTVDNSLSSSLLIKYTRTNVVNIFTTTAAYSSSADGVTKEKYYVENEFDYNFLDSYKQFLFFDTNSTFDLFSPYDYVWVTSSGYGLSPVANSNWNWKLQLGPGWRRLRDRSKRTTSDYLILNTGSKLSYTLDKSGKSKISEAVIYNVGQPYDYFSTNTSLAMQIMQHLSAVLSYQLEWTSTIPAGSSHTKRTDTLTAVNLVFTY